MSDPAYHLRTNKYVERLLFVELLKQVEPHLRPPLKKFHYVGLGGPYLADFALLQDEFAFEKMICLETKQHVKKRQEFNLPHCRITTTRRSTAEFLKKFSPSTPQVVWLDYSRPDWRDQISEFCELLASLPSVSIAKITLVCENSALDKGNVSERASRLKEMFEDYGPFCDEDVQSKRFPITMYRILHQAVGARLGDVPSHCAATLASFLYNDGTPILTVALAVGEREIIDNILSESDLRNWGYGNLDWDGPKSIDVPTLTLRERLAIDRYLPDGNAADILKEVAVSVESGITPNTAAVEQYIAFHKYVPFFVDIRGTY